jgi:hypothetical protein
MTDRATASVRRLDARAVTATSLALLAAGIVDGLLWYVRRRQTG